MILQLYFTNKAQKDVLEELTTLSSQINAISDVHLSHVFSEKRDLSAERASEDFRLRKREIESETEQGEEEITYLYKDLKKNGKRPGLDKPAKIMAGRDSMLRRRLANLPADSTGKYTISRAPYLKGYVEWNNSDSHRYVIQEVEVNLNRLTGEDSKPKPKKREILIKKKAPQLTFVMPDFTRPDTPRLVRYKYSTADLSKALQDIRNRNLVTTLLIFLISIVVIMLVTNRFLKPIGSLKNSFNLVVQGNLDENVREGGRDEIGELTRAFNQMVFELKKNREKENILRRKERLASLGQLAAGVAHEVKNPLNAINLTIDHLNDKLPGDKQLKAEKYIKSIQSEIRRLDKIVNNFLNYVRSEKLEKTDTDINALLREVTDLYEREMSEKNIELFSELQESFVLNVDGGRLQTVFVNIILNAIQAMPGGGRLYIRTNPAEKQISIRDTGTGIDRKTLESIFDLFYTTKSKGSGLGMPTAYKIIKEHEGELRILSEPGKGTEVIIQL